MVARPVDPTSRKSVEGPPESLAGLPKVSGSTIRAVELETGIGALVLRAWERRFGFPSPERRPGSDRRVYSAADIERLKWIKRALARGYRIGDVIHKSFEELRHVAGAGSEAGPPPPSEASTDLVSIRSMLALLASERMDEFDSALRRKKATTDVRRFLVEFAHPLMVEVGRAWESARLSVRHEHLATDSMTTILRQMFAEVQPTGVSPTIVLGALPGEIYSLPLLFVSLYLSASGARVRLLGGQTPVDELADAGKALRADIVGVAVSNEFDPAVAKRSIRALRSKLPNSTALWVGGTGARSVKVPRVDIVDTWVSLEEALERARSST